MLRDTEGGQSQDNSQDGDEALNDGNELEDEIDDDDQGENNEFLMNGHDLDLPEDESSDEENKEDLKGEATDSEMEEYYEELGIKNRKKLKKTV